MHHVVIVGDDDALAARDLECRNAVELGFEARWVAYVADALVTKAENDGRRVVGAAVIEDEEFEIPVGLGQDASMASRR